MDFISLLSQAYLLDYEGSHIAIRKYCKLYDDDMAKNSNFSHIFCGPHNVRGAWCLNCKKPLLRFLSLDLADDRLKLVIGITTRIDFFYCWTCDFAKGQFFYKILSSDEISIITNRHSISHNELTYDDYPNMFPRAKANLYTIAEKSSKNNTHGQYRTC